MLEIDGIPLSEGFGLELSQAPMREITVEPRTDFRLSPTTQLWLTQRTGHTDRRIRQIVLPATVRLEDGSLLHVHP